jgi:hypothetical protein
LRYASVKRPEDLHGVLCFIGMFTLASYKTRHRGHHRPPEAHAATLGRQPDGISQDPPPAAGAAWAMGPPERGSDGDGVKGGEGAKKPRPAPGRAGVIVADSRSHSR